VKFCVILLACLCLIGCDDSSTDSDSGNANIEVVSKTFKITEKNDYYWSFSWQTELENTGGKDAEVFYKVNFRDQDNYIIDYDYESVEIRSGQQVNCSGICPIEPGKAIQVTRMTVNIGNVYD